MAEIRPLERNDLPAVARLLDENILNWAPGKGGTEFLSSTLLDDPWSDPELPALVAIDDGKLIGFIGSQVRRFRLDDRLLRGVCASHLAVSPDARGGATGALLLRRMLTAGQEFSFSDTANDDVARMWQAFGGHLDHVRSCDWMIVLKPLRWLGGVGARAIRRRPVGREQVPVGAFPFQAAGRHIAKRAFPEQEAGVSGEDVDTATIVEQLPAIAHGFRLRADYDEQFLNHLFGSVQSQVGRLVRRLVRRGGQPVGWYAYLSRAGGVSRVLHLAAPEGFGDAVLGDLLAHARSEHSAVVTGRLEPHLLWPLRHRLAILGFARQPVIHTHDPEIESVLATSASLVTQLDSEWFVT